MPFAGRSDFHQDGTITSPSFTGFAGGLGLADESSEVAELIASTGCGLCVPPDDPAKIAEAMLQLKNAPEKSRGMAEKGRRYAEREFSKSVVLGRYEKLLAGLA